jgi:hypothetical protein
VRAFPGVYHVELRKFPHSVSRFNQSEQQLLALVVPFVRGEWIEIGERKWNTNETKLTVLEGPELSLQDMSMNRGWRNAQRRSDDVTERVLAAVRAQHAVGAGGGEAVRAPSPAIPAHPAAAPVAPGSAPRESETTGSDVLLADSLALELLAQLDAGPMPLTRLWELSHARLGDGAPAASSLALAEAATRSLLARGLAQLVCESGRCEGGEAVAVERIDDVLADVASWGAACSGSVAIARKR